MKYIMSSTGILHITPIDKKFGGFNYTITLCNRNIETYAVWPMDGDYDEFNVCKTCNKKLNSILEDIQNGMD